MVEQPIKRNGRTRCVAFLLVPAIVGAFLAITVIFTAEEGPTEGGLPGEGPKVEIEVRAVISAPAELDNRSDNIHQVLIDLIDNAKDTVDIEALFFADHDMEVYSVIRAAADRGVKVRVLLDERRHHVDYDYGHPAILDDHPNIELRTLNFDNLGRGTGIIHAKMVVVDGETSFIGSYNFIEGSFTQNREVCVVLRGGQLSGAFAHIFEKDWGRSAGKTYAGALPWSREQWLEQAVYPVESAPEEINSAEIPDTEDEVLEIINSAEEEIRIMMYEFNPKIRDSDESYSIIDDAIEAAADRGVDVKIIINCLSYWNYVAYHKAMSSHPNIDVKWMLPPENLSVFWYHAKVIFADGERALIGSANFAESYMRETREVGIVASDAGVISELERVFSNDWNSKYATPVVSEG